MTISRIPGRRPATGLALLALAAALPLGADAVPVAYYESVFNVTSAPGVQIGLGSLVIEDVYTYLTFSFTGDTDDVHPYLSGRTNGFVINKGSASVQIRTLTATGGSDITAHFDPGELYVGSDITNNGIGFGSRIYPVYPYAMFGGADIDLSQPAYDLTHDFRFLGFAVSCVGLASDVCRNKAPDGPKYGLHTDLGDFWVSWKGITTADFSVVTSPAGGPLPEPDALGLAGLALAVLWLQALRRKSDRGS